MIGEIVNNILYFVALYGMFIIMYFLGVRRSKEKILKIIRDEKRRFWDKALSEKDSKLEMVWQHKSDMCGYLEELIEEKIDKVRKCGNILI